MLTVVFLLAICSFVCAILNAIGKCPLWVAVILLCIIHLLTSIPLGR